MSTHLVRGKNWADACVRALEDRHPLCTGPLSDAFGKLQPEAGPLVAVMLRNGAHLAVVGEAETFKKQCVKLGLDRTEREPTTVSSLVDPIKRRTTVEEIRPSRPGPITHSAHRMKHRCQQCSAVDDGGVNHLAGTGARRVYQCG